MAVRVAVALAGAVLLASCAGAASSGPASASGGAQTPLVEQASGDPLRGRALAERLCAACHAVGPRGASPDPAAPPLRTLGERYRVGMLQEAFAEGIAVGHPAMPEFQFEADESDDLLAFLAGLQERRADPES